MYNLYMIDYKELFNYNDYIELNKDLTHLKNNEDILNHWNNIGIKQMRLCNKKQLEIINEFGNETILYLPYYYYLYKNNLLFDNKIITYKGMKPFYYFLDTNNTVKITTHAHAHAAHSPADHVELVERFGRASA